MKSLLATLAFATIDLAAGQVFSHHVVTLAKDGVEGDPVETTDAEITFDDLEPGTYTASGFSVDAVGNPMSEVVVSEPLVIAADASPGTATVIRSITLSLTPAADTPLPVIPEPPAAPV